MAWIRTIDESDADEQLAPVYDRLAKDRGKISNIMRVQSLQPTAMQAHLDLYLSVMFGRSGMSREEREMIAVTVSAANRCDYCVAHHAAALNAYWRDTGRLKEFLSRFQES